MEISFYWKGASLSSHAIISLNSFYDHGHQCILYAHDKISNVPNHVRLEDATQVLDFHESLCLNSGFGKGSPAPFADLFRFTLLKQRGGIWADLDVVCLKPWFNLPARFIASLLEIPEGPMPNINVVRLAKHSDTFAETWIHLWTTRRNQEGYAAVVIIAHLAYQKCGQKPVLMRLTAFNPVSYRNAVYLIRNFEPFFHPRLLKRKILGAKKINISLPEQAYKLHLWGQVWRENGWKEDQIYPANTLYGKLQARYL